MQGKVEEDAPPLFIAVAANDALNLQQQSIDFFTAWNTVKKDAELHVYNQGSHGFGMRVQHTTSDTWIERLTDWMAVKELIKK
jgi:dipeptidyl aminopeptidase/acylaminoacyl peptidase